MAMDYKVPVNIPSCIWTGIWFAKFSHRNTSTGGCLTSPLALSYPNPWPAAETSKTWAEWKKRPEFLFHLLVVGGFIGVAFPRARIISSNEINSCFASVRQLPCYNTQRPGLLSVEFDRFESGMCVAVSSVMHLMFFAPETDYRRMVRHLFLVFAPIFYRHGQLTYVVFVVESVVNWQWVWQSASRSTWKLRETARLAWQFVCMQKG